MTEISQFNSRFWRSLLTRILVIAACVTLIVWLLPRNEELRLHYQVGQPWMYNTLIAPFEFPVYKSDETIKAEQDSVLKDFQPYYNYEVDVEKTAIANFESDFPGLCQGCPSTRGKSSSDISTVSIRPASCRSRTSTVPTRTRRR